MKEKRINFKAIALSLIFLLNPNVSIIDVFPDFIGYILLCVSLVKLGDINDTVAGAITQFKRMIFIDAGKILAIFWTFGMGVSTEKDTSLLLWAFVFGVLEVAIVIPAFFKLFKGLTELGYVCDNTSILGYKQKKMRNYDMDEKAQDQRLNKKRIRKRQAKRNNYTDKILAFTIFFVAAKAFLSVLPEFSNLTVLEYYENPLMNLYQYIGTMRALSFIPVIVIGIIWFVKAYRYFARISKDDSFNCAISELYVKNVLPKKGIFVKRNVAICFAIVMVAAVFSLDFRLENINMLPDIISAVGFLLFFCILSKRTEIKRSIALMISSLYIVTSIVYMVMERKFFQDFYYGAIFRSEDALTAFSYLVISSCANSVVFLIISLVCASALQSVIKNHVGLLDGVGTYNIAAQQRMNEATRAELSKKLVYFIGASVFYVATDIAYTLFAKDFGFMFIINVVGALVYIATLAKTYYDISEAVSATYILE